MTLKFVDNPDSLLPKVLEQLSDADEEYATDRETQEKRLKPGNTFITRFEDYMENWTTWTSEVELYMCPVEDSPTTYVLLELNWDDNWGCYEWSAAAAVTGAQDLKSAETALLNYYVDDRLAPEEESSWADFLRGLRS